MLDRVEQRGGNNNPNGVNQYTDRSKTKGLVFDTDENSKEYKTSALRTAKLISVSDVQVTKMRTIMASFIPSYSKV